MNFMIKEKTCKINMLTCFLLHNITDSGVYFLCIIRLCLRTARIMDSKNLIKRIEAGQFFLTIT